MGRIAGKIAIVTGGAQGLGEAAVERLSAEGAHVILTDMDEAAGQQTAQKYGADFIAQDVRDEAGWEQLMAATLKKHGRLDVLVNNAGIFSSCPVDETPLEDYRRVLEVNVIGVFLGCKYGVRAMKQNADPKGGSIINMSSVTGLRGQVGGAAYTSSKGAVRSLTKTVAMETAGHYIRCNSVHPGIHLTPMMQNLLDAAGDDGPAMKAHIEGYLPMGEMGTAGDIGDMVLFLASEESRYITGAEMVVDGGMTVGLPQ